MNVCGDSGPVEPEHNLTDCCPLEQTDTLGANSADDSAKDSVLEDAGVKGGEPCDTCVEDSPGQKVDDSGIGHSSFEASTDEKSGYEVTSRCLERPQPSGGQ